MLKRIAIKNIVLIEEAEMNFQRGLCVLSGETGAGKSILLDSLGFVLGSKNETRLLREGAEKASVIAEFSLDDAPNIAALLEELGLEAAQEIILRRQIGTDGKSRAFVNDEAISSKALKQLGELLVEVHGQHQQRGLMDATGHGALLDAYGKLEPQIAHVAIAYEAWKTAKTELAKLTAALKQAAKERDYLEHMLEELDKLQPQMGEEEELSDTRIEMMQSEKRATLIDDALKELHMPKAITQILRSAQGMLARSTLQGIEMFSPAIDALEKAMLEVQEAESVLEELGRDCAYNPQELERIEERLFALKDAARKYGIPADELPILLEEVREKLNNLQSQESKIAELEKTLAQTQKAYLEIAHKLRNERQKAAQKLESSLHIELEPLKMAATRFRVMLDERPESSWSARGIDEIYFEASTNRGSAFGALSAIASGGELSRFMLALAVVLAEIKSMPCMVFDEIDTGTGGAVADAIGKRLGKLGLGSQVLVVTHLPQVAACGQQHFHIEKNEIAGKTTTRVQELSATAREEELARMLSGAEVSQEARLAARKLLEQV